MKKYFLLITLLMIGYGLFAQSKAHLLSRYTIIDPTYNSIKLSPASNYKTGKPWIYGYAELESWQLQKMIKDTKEAELNVNYPGEFHTSSTKVSFLLNINKKLSSTKFSFRAVGDVKVLINQSVVYKSAAKKTTHTFILPKSIFAKTVRFDLTTNSEPPCLLIEQGVLNTGSKRWQWQTGNQKWQAAFQLPQIETRQAPHLSQPSIKTMVPTSYGGNFFDFGKELFGYITIKSPTKPQLSIGESTLEALDTLNTEIEQTNAVIPIANGSWRTKVPVAFRYVKVLGGINATLNCDALFYPVKYQGAFASSDSLLTKIWMQSAYTLRLCMNNFIIDGVKRDRLPWAGDLAMSLQTNAYTFADQEIVRRTLVALGREGIGKKDINGIVDYTLWWIIAQNLYQLYYADKEHLNREWPRIKQALAILNDRCNANGFIDPKGTWLFIDWVEGDKNTALQILWWWAQQSGSQLAKRAGDTEEVKLLTRNADKVKKTLLNTAWNENSGAWMDDPFHPTYISRHANILAVTSGLAPVNQYRKIENVLTGNTANKVATPYMEGFGIMALNRIGATNIAIDNLKAYWGGMIKNGASSFWEAYDQDNRGKELYAFYKRPYANSLCHAWSAGPAALLPAEVLGVKPLEDGWKVFSCNPALGLLGWVNATIPTPHGKILIEIENKKISIQIPAGTTLLYQGEYVKGPRLFINSYE